MNHDKSYNLLLVHYTVQRDIVGPAEVLQTMMLFPPLMHPLCVKLEQRKKINRVRLNGGDLRRNVYRKEKREANERKRSKTGIHTQGKSSDSESTREMSRRVMTACVLPYGVRFEEDMKWIACDKFFTLCHVKCVGVTLSLPHQFFCDDC